MNTGIKKVLTFRASSIGDSLMGAYFLENVRETYPNARYGIVVAGRAGMIRDVLAAYPWIEVIEVNRKKPKSLLALWREWNHTDITLTQYAGKGGAFSLASKIVARILTRKGGLLGFNDTFWGNALLFDHVLRLVPKELPAPAELERSALEALSLPAPIPFPVFAFTPQKDIQNKFMPAGQPFAVVHLFPGNDTRGLSPERRKELAHVLEETFGDSVTILFSGTKSDKSLLEPVVQGTHAENIAGAVSLQELASLLNKAKFVISVDTGVGHIAAQIGVPIIVLRTCMGRGWWSTEQYGNRKNLIQFCRSELCGGSHAGESFPACINEIDFMRVAEAARTLSS